MPEQFLKAGFVALGGAGSAMGLVFREKGYPCIDIDVDSVQGSGHSRISLLGGPWDEVYVPEQVRQSLNSQAGAIRQRVSQWVEDEALDSLVLLGGLGGRTGMHLASLLSILEELPLIRLVAGVVPHDLEHPYSKARSVEALAGIVAQAPDSLILVDNAQWFNRSHLTEDELGYTEANRRFASQFECANRWLDMAQGPYIKKIPLEWIRALFKAGGVLTFGEFDVEVPNHGMDAQDLVRKCRDFWRSPGVLMPLDEEPQTLFFLCALEGDESLVEGCIGDLAFQFCEIVGEQTGAYAHLALFGGPDSKKIRGRVLLSSSTLPGRVEGLMSQAAREAKLLRHRARLLLPSIHEDDRRMIQEAAAEGGGAGDEKGTALPSRGGDRTLEDDLMEYSRLDAEETQRSEEAPDFSVQEEEAEESYEEVGLPEEETFLEDENFLDDDLFGELEEEEGLKEEAEVGIEEFLIEEREPEREKEEEMGAEGGGGGEEEEEVAKEELGEESGTEEEAWDVGEELGEEEEKAGIVREEEDVEEEELEDVEADKIFADINQFLDDTGEGFLDGHDLLDDPVLDKLLDEENLGLDVDVDIEDLLDEEDSERESGIDIDDFLEDFDRPRAPGRFVESSSSGKGYFDITVPEADNVISEEEQVINLDHEGNAEQKENPEQDELTENTTDPLLEETPSSVEEEEEEVEEVEDFVSQPEALSEPLTTGVHWTGEWAEIAEDLNVANPPPIRMDAVSRLLKKLKDSDSMIRLKALRLLWEAKGFKIWPKVTEMLSDEAEAVRGLAKEMLRRERG